MLIDMKFPYEGLRLSSVELTMIDGTKYVMPIDETSRCIIRQPAPEPIMSDGRFTADGQPGIAGYLPSKYVEVELIGRMYRPHQITLVKEPTDASEEERSMGEQR